MRMFWTLLLLCAVSLPVFCEPVPLVIWQKEKRYQPQPGETLTLQRQAFRLVFPLLEGQNLRISVGVPPRPAELQSFDPGRGMAGPYDGLILDWEAHHYLYYDPTDPRDRADLWDRARGLCSWNVSRMFARSGDGLAELESDDFPDLEVVVRKEGFEDLNFRVRWVR